MALSKMTSRRSGGAQGQRFRLGCCNVPITLRLQLENVATSLGPSSMSLGPSSLLWLCRRPVPDSFSAIETIISQTQSIVSNAQKWPRTQRIL